MKAIDVARRVWLVLVFPVCLVVPCRAHDSMQALEVNLLKSAELRSERLVPLGQMPMLFVSEVKGQETQIPVFMVEMDYLCELVSVGAEDGMRKKTVSLLCYEIRSKGDVPYMWTMWSGTGLGHPRLFAKENGKNILAWVEGATLLIGEVSEPNDRLAELTHFLSRQAPPEYQHVPVGVLVPEVKSWGVNALYFDISVRSIRMDDAGKMTITFSGPDSERIYTIVRDGGEWQRK